MSENFSKYISVRLKGLRSERGWSLDATSKMTGVSKAMLGQIERGESNPTVGVLWKIATGFETSFSSFLVDFAAENPEERSFPDDPHMHVRTLFPYTAELKMEVFEITLTNNHVQRSEPHRAGCIEHVIVIEGEMDVFFDGREHRLQKGECIWYFADQPHGYSAVGDESVFHNIINYR